MPQVNDFDYDLVLQWDINTRGNTQWFYFSVANTVPGRAYTFRIVNLTKGDSLFNQGMQPLVYSCRSKEKSGVGWKRAGERVALSLDALYVLKLCMPGEDICYYGNDIKRGKHSHHYSVVWSYTFEHAEDVVYFAYCYPYRYVPHRYRCLLTLCVLPPLQLLQPPERPAPHRG